MALKITKKGFLSNIATILIPPGSVHLWLGEHPPQDSVALLKTKNKKKIKKRSPPKNYKKNLKSVALLKTINKKIKKA